MSAAASAPHPSRLRERAFQGELLLTPVSRRPTRLEESTLRRILDRPVPAFGASTAQQPEVSVVVVTRDNLPFLRLCLENVLDGTERPCELIVVDNSSSDGTHAYLARLAERNPNVRVIGNEHNRGFAAACNQGAAMATAEVLVLLNDDTVVCNGWLEPLLAHLALPRVGMVGPSTNRTGNEAQVDAEYRTLDDLARFADARSREHAGEAFEIATLTMFCVAMLRSLYEQVGPLDERFEIGLLEDDDYSRRVREAGYRLLCADDAFVHHFGETSFGKLAASGEYARVLEANRARFEEKWQEPWRPYGRRQSDRYRELVRRVRQEAVNTVPANATVLVVSRGDEELLRLDGRRAWHFPRTDEGSYAGHHPADSREAVALLEEQRTAGAEYIVFPATAAWWLEHYEGLGQHLDGRYERTPADPETCFIFDLRERAVSDPTIVCILGMHRSGTSLVSRVLNVLGLYLGPEEHLMRPSTDNPAGHWESRPIKEINEEILSILGGSWSEPPPLPAGWERSPELAAPRRRAREVIEEDFSGSSLWGFKDPRSSLTLPFWQRILDPMRYVICLRNPLDAAASARARKDDTVPFEQGIALWLTYVRSALTTTAGHPRQLVFYEDLMADPEPVVRELARLIGREKSSDSESDIRTAISVAVTEGLWHHRTAVPNVVDASGLPFHIKAFYVALRQFVPGAETVGHEALDLLGAYAADAGNRQARLNAAVEELKRTREQVRILKRRGIALEQRLAERGDKLQRATAERDEQRRLRKQQESERQRLAGERDEERSRRRRFESELAASRRELSRRQASADRGGSDAAPATAAPRRHEDEGLVSEVRERAVELIPEGATVLVAGKGDEAFLRLDGPTGWHFPMAEDGRYAGFHPAGDTSAIAQLEALRARGADHLLLPATTLWWLDHYQGLRRHLEDRYTPLLTDGLCAIYRLTTDERAQAGGAMVTLKRTIACLRIRTGRDPSILDWGSGLGIADHLPEAKVFSPPGDKPTLPYLDGTADVVVVPAGAALMRLAEARRVAASAVIRVESDSPERAELDWLAGGPSGWGEDVSVTMIPDADDSPWDPTLAAFAEALNGGFAGEFSAAGDPEILGTASELAAAAGVSLRQVEAPAGTGAARRAQAAAESSDRRLQIFLTAPAVPLPGWLPSILALLGPDRDAGVVGARIVSRFGVLEEAGGILAADGMRERRGEGDANPDRPEYCFVQRVDFCSPPLLATRRDLFDRLGGFDQGPMADALVDFSLRAGQAGAPVYYQPEARIVAIGNGDR